MGTLFSLSHFYAEGLTQTCWEEGTAAPPSGCQAGTCSVDTRPSFPEVSARHSAHWTRTQQAWEASTPPSGAGVSLAEHVHRAAADGTGAAGHRVRGPGAACRAKARDPRLGRTHQRRSRTRPLCLG